MRSPTILTMVLAGGLGERLYPLTANRSKPAVPFGGTLRIIDFTLMNCVLSGLRSVHVLTQYHSHSLDRHRSDHWSFLSSELGEFIEIVPPRMRTTSGFYRGTADAVYRNLDLLDRRRPDAVLVLSGDHVYRANYRRLIESHLARDADVTVLTGSVPAHEARRFGVLRVDSRGRIVRFVEKPRNPAPHAEDDRCRVNLGVYCFRTTFLVEELIRDSKRRTSHDFGKNILPASLQEGLVVSCPFDAVCPDDQPYWRDVGTIDSYFHASMDLLETRPCFELRDPRWPQGSGFLERLPTRFPANLAMGPGTSAAWNLVSNGCDVGAAYVRRSLLSPGVRIGHGSQIEECILLHGCSIGRGAKLHRSIVEEGVEIPDGAEVGGDSRSEQLTVSPEGITVIPSGYRFESPSPGRQGQFPRAGRDTARAPAARARALSRATPAPRAP